MTSTTEQHKQRPRVLPMPTCPRCGSPELRVRTSRALNAERTWRETRFICKTCDQRFPVMFQAQPSLG